MSFGEKKTAESTVASARAAKRLFEQLFRASHGPALHFESVVHNGECKWVVLFRRHVCVVPLNASSAQKAVSIPIANVTSMRLDKNDNFLFADEEKTLKSAKVIIRYEEQQAMKQRRASMSTSPVRRILAGRRGSAAAAMEEASQVEEKIVHSESFHVFDDRTRVWIYLYQMWIGNLISQLYGWARSDEMPENRVKELYVDLQREIHSCKDIQARVDLLDELAHATRFNVCLKRCVLLQAPSMLQWINAELRRFTCDKWRAQADMQGLGRAEALQYLTVLLEMLHKALFQCWPVFTGDSEAELDKLLEPRAGVIVQLVQTLWLPFVLAEELRSKESQAAHEAMHSLIGVLYEMSLLFSAVEAHTYQEGGQVSKQQQLRYFITHGVTDKHIERRVETLVLALQSVLLSMSPGPYKIATAYHYAFVLNHLCVRDVSQISKAVQTQHADDLRFVLPSYISAEAKETSHPLSKKTCALLQGLLSTFCPDLAPSTSKAVASAEGVLNFELET